MQRSGAIGRLRSEVVPTVSSSFVPPVEAIRMRTIAVVNHKGGVGKTTTALGLAVGLARRLRKGRRLLFIDGDAQGNASTTLLDGKAPNKPTLTAILLDDSDVAEAIRPSRYPGIDILPADPSLADCTVWLADQIGREQRLRTALETVGDPYDLVIIDAPPAMSLVSVNILHAVEELVVPVDAGAYAVMGLARLSETVEKIRRHLSHPALTIIGLVLTRVMKNRATRELEAQLRETYGKLVYDSVIPYSTHVELAAAHHRTVLEYAPKSPAAVATEALVREVLKNHGRKRVNARRSRRVDDAA
jgi:chromosome partitioning protein